MKTPVKTMPSENATFEYGRSVNGSSKLGVTPLGGWSASSVGATTMYVLAGGTDMVIAIRSRTLLTIVDAWFRHRTRRA